VIFCADFAAFGVTNDVVDDDDDDDDDNYAPLIRQGVAAKTNGPSVRKVSHFSLGLSNVEEPESEGKLINTASILRCINCVCG